MRFGPCAKFAPAASGHGIVEASIYRSNYTALTYSGASKCSRCANTAKVLRCYSVAVVSAKTAKVLRFS